MKTTYVMRLVTVNAIHAHAVVANVNLLITQIHFAYAILME